MSGCHQHHHVLDHLGTIRRQSSRRIGRLRHDDRPSTSAERDEFRRRVEADPRNYIAQPTINLSRAPCIIDGKVKLATSICARTGTFGEKTTDGLHPRRASRKRLARRRLVGGNAEHLGASHPASLKVFVDEPLPQRAERTSRDQVQLNLMLERETETASRHWRRRLKSLAVEMTDVKEGESQALAKSLIHSTGSRSSIVSCIMAARENSRQVRRRSAPRRGSRYKPHVH